MSQDFKIYRQKLDKNNDGLISLEEYLSNEESLGPKAKAGKIGYNYQHFDNIVSYFKIVLRKFRKFNILCVPDFIIEYDKYIEKTALFVNVETNDFIYGKNMAKSISKCKSKNKVRFIYFSVILKFKKMNHANIVIIDLKEKTLERFEPHGAYFIDGLKTKEKNKKVNKLFKKNILTDLNLKDFKYLEPKNLSPEIGVQQITDAYCGMCVTISMMYLHLRLLNPDIKQKKLIKFLINRPKNKLKEMILKYAKHVEETLKKNEKYVLDLFNEVLDEL